MRRNQRRSSKWITGRSTPTADLISAKASCGVSQSTLVRTFCGQPSSIFSTTSLSACLSMPLNIERYQRTVSGFAQGNMSFLMKSISFSPTLLGRHSSPAVSREQKM